MAAGLLHRPAQAPRAAPQEQWATPQAAVSQRRPQAVLSPELTSREQPGVRQQASDRLRAGAAAVLTLPAGLGLSSLRAVQDVPLEGATAVASPVAKVAAPCALH